MNDKRVDAEIPMPEGTEVEFLGPDLALLSLPNPAAEIPALLTTAECDIALRVYAGATYQEIATARSVSVKTVSRQLEAIYKKLGVHSRYDLVMKLRGKRR